MPQRRAQQMIGEEHSSSLRRTLRLVHWLHQPLPSELPPKARLLSEAAAAGLPVPRGLVHTMGWHETLAREVTTLLDGGEVIVRAALEGEDGPQRAAAGLGLSIPGCGSVQAVRDALARVDAARRDPWLVRYRGAQTRAGDCVIVQRQVVRDALVVAAVLPDGIDYIEVHGENPEALSQGDSPIASGLLSRWEDPRAAAAAELLTQLRAALPMPEHGFDAELILDPHGMAHLVQVRPLTRDLTADGRAFVDAVRSAGQASRLGGVQVLDAEHNPAPLSPAHASLIAWLAEQRPASGGLSTLAGWLYVRTRVRDLSGNAQTPHLTAADALVRLRDHELPAARARLATIQSACADPQRLLRTLDESLAAFLAMIDVYLGVLLPVRAAAGQVFAATPEAPLSLRGRAAHADILPTAWDLAAPTLGELASFDPSPEPAELPSDPTAAAVLLTEWDDHLFALGLAPVRAVYRACAQQLGIGELAFGLTLSELRHALQDSAFPAAATGRAQLEQTQRWSQLRPPAVLDEGRPLPLLPHRLLHGVGVGSDFQGPIAQRSSLEALMRDPPSRDSIVVLPALTAQAALALQTLRLRAVCCEHGGALSHAALMLRELGLSGLIGCAGCTQVPDGTPARIDTASGRLQIASSAALGS